MYSNLHRIKQISDPNYARVWSNTVNDILWLQYAERNSQVTGWWVTQTSTPLIFDEGSPNQYTLRLIDEFGNKTGWAQFFDLSYSELEYELVEQRVI